MEFFLFLQLMLRVSDLNYSFRRRGKTWPRNMLELIRQKLSECLEKLSLSLEVGTGITSREISLIIVGGKNWEAAGRVDISLTSCIRCTKFVLRSIVVEFLPKKKASNVERQKKIFLSLSCSVQARFKLRTYLLVRHDHKDEWSTPEAEEYYILVLNFKDENRKGCYLKLESNRRCVISDQLSIPWRFVQEVCRTVIAFIFMFDKILAETIG